MKGKTEISAGKSSEILKGTALGKPITAGGTSSTTPGALTGPPSSDIKTAMSTGNFSQVGAITQPPQGATKYYTVPGIDGVVELSDDDVAKAKARHIPIEEVSPDVLQQLSQH
jgi:hypothetical protein